ncbi:MAG: nitrite reductase small subunit NirD [Anaerolineae bacterium]
MKQWIKVAKSSDFIENGGGCIKHGDLQIAVFNFNRQNWYAVQNLCPHTRQTVLSRGLIGDKNGEPKVACPLHKQQFSLVSGTPLGGAPDYQLTTYPIKEEAGYIYLQLEA